MPTKAKEICSSCNQKDWNHCCLPYPKTMRNCNQKVLTGQNIQKPQSKRKFVTKLYKLWCFLYMITDAFLFTPCNDFPPSCTKCSRLALQDISETTSLAATGHHRGERRCATTVSYLWCFWAVIFTSSLTHRSHPHMNVQNEFNCVKSCMIFIVVVPAFWNASITLMSTKIYDGAKVKK